MQQKLEPLPELGNRKTAKHSYDVQVWWTNAEGKGMWRLVDVYATNRDHAARLANRAGYANVGSVNMTG